MNIGKLRFPKWNELAQLIVQIFFIAACLAMFVRYGVKYDTGQGYREVILMFVGTYVLQLLFLKNIKVYYESILFYIIGILIIISFLFSEIKSYGIAEIFGFFAVANTILIISQLNAKKIQILIWGLLLIASIACLYGLYQFTFVQTEIRIMGNFLNPLDLKQGFPNAMALFILILWPYAALKAVETKSKFQNIISISILGLLIATLYLTFSRGAYISFIIQLIILTFINFKYFWSNKFKWLAGTIISVLLVFLILFLRSQNNIETKDIGEKLTFGNNENITSVEERIDFFKKTSSFILEKPLFGYGPQTFRFIYPSKQELLYANSDHPHNLILKIAYESGIISAILLLIVFVSLGIKSLKKTIIQKVFIIIAITGGFAHNMIDYNFNFLLIYIIFAISIGLLINQVNENSLQSNITNRALLSKSFFIIFFIFTSLLSFIGIRDFFKTDPYSDFQTIKRYTETEIQTHILKYSESLYPREFWIQLSDYYYTKNNLAKALEMLEKHIVNNPHDIFGFVNKGRILNDQGKYEDALLAFTKAIKLDPKNSLAVHYYYLKTFETIKQSPPATYLQNTLYPILNDFMYYAEHNLHFVTMKPEIKYAECIMEILQITGNKYKDWKELSHELNEYEIKYNKGFYPKEVCI